MRELILKSEEIRVKRMFDKRPDTPYAAAKKAREILASFAKDPREREWIKRIDFAKVAKYLGFEGFSKKHNKGKQKVQDILKTEMYKKFNGDFVEDRKRKEKKSQYQIPILERFLLFWEKGDALRASGLDYEISNRTANV